MIFGIGRAQEVPQEEMLMEEFWAKNEAALKQEIEASLEDFKSHPEYDRVVGERLAIEQDFCQKIFDVLDKPKAEEVGKKAPVLLFDVDGTLGYQSYDEPAGFKMRPSAKILLEQVIKPRKDNRRLSVGLLTTRGSKALANQLNDSNELAALKEYLDKEMIISTLEEGPRGEDDPKTFLGQDPSVVSSGIISAEKLADPSARFAMGDVDKVAALAKLSVSKQMRQRRIMVADDLPYTRLLNSSKGLHAADITGCAWEAPIPVKS